MGEAPSEADAALATTPVVFTLGFDKDFIMRFSHFVVVLSVLVLVACGDPRDKELPLDLSAAADARATFVQLTSAEQEAVSRYEIRRAARLAKGDETARKSVTYRQAIADERVFETAEAQQAVAARVKQQAQQAESDAKDEAAKAQAEVDAHALNTSITCALESKSITPAPKADMPVFPLPQASYDLACRNTSGADVHGFKGSLNLKGPFSEWIAVLPVRRDDTLAADASFEEKINQPFVSVGDGMNALAFHDLAIDKITVQVQLDSLVLADGRLIKSHPF